MIVTNEKELSKAIKEESIEIEINDPKLEKSVIKMKATGTVAWGVVIIALTIAVGSLLSTAATAGLSSPITIGSSLISSGAAVGVLGASTTSTAIAIAVAGGGVGVLNKLRKYNLKRTDGRVILQRKFG